MVNKILQALTPFRPKKIEYMSIQIRNQVRDSFLEAFNNKRQEKSFNVFSLVIGCKINTVEQFSGKVVQVKDFDDDGSFSAF